MLAVIAGTANRAAEHTIAIARSDCEWAARCAPSPDMAHQPAIDVNGQLVTPAEAAGMECDDGVELTDCATRALAAMCRDAADHR